MLANDAQRTLSGKVTGLTNHLQSGRSYFVGALAVRFSNKFSTTLSSWISGRAAFPTNRNRLPSGNTAVCGDWLSRVDSSDGSVKEAKNAVLHCAIVVRRLAITAIIAIVLGGPIVEMFDRWDTTVQDDNDTEANAVIAALCVGIALSVGTIAVASRLRMLSFASAERVIVPLAAVHDAASLVAPIPTISPPTILRV